MNKWTQKEIKFLIKKYSNKKDKELSKEMNRSTKSISYMAVKLRLRKNKKFYSISRRHLKIEITKKELIRYYIEQKKSIRRIASELNVSKGIIEYYLIKYSINRRDKSESTRERFKWDIPWNKDKSKDINPKLKEVSRKLKLIWKNKREEKIRDIETRFRIPISKLLNKLYWEEELNLEEIGKKLGYDRSIISNLFKEYNISLRPNFQYISSLKGVNHSHFGKSWITLFGKEKADKLRKKASTRARNSIIRRISNNEFPFFNTKIELKLSEEMTKRGIPFINQFNIDNKFVCDFAIPSSKLIIECDGDYWHANPFLYSKKDLDKRQKINVYRDKIKDKYINEKGWKILRFFELDIKKSPIKCVDEIERYINS